MSAVDQLAFEPGQQIKCETRHDETFTGEVVAFDLQSNIIIIKSPSSSGTNANKDLHFIMVKNCADIQVIEESQGDFTKDLPHIEMKYIQAKQQTAINERMRLVEAVGNGVSKDGISLFLSLSKKFDRASDLTWNDKVKIVVMNAVVIKPPYKESDCELTNPTSKNDAITYVKNLVKKFWENP